MEINSININQSLTQTFGTNKNSSQDGETDTNQLDSEIQNLEQKKSTLNSKISNIKGNFKPQKTKDQSINSLESELQSIDAKIQQKKAQKLKKKSDGKSKVSNNISNKKANLNKKASTNISDSNLTTQTGFTNKSKAKGILKNPPTTYNTFDKSDKYIKTAIATYNLMENGSSETNLTNKLV